jgi:molecular chaperone DnaK
MKKEKVKATVEITDTYGGEANYSWVQRKEIEAKTQALLQASQKLQAAAQPGQAQPGADNAKNAGDDVVDAEFEEVKDK